MSALWTIPTLLYLIIWCYRLHSRVDKQLKRIQTIEKRLVELEITVDDLEEEHGG